MNVRAFGFVLLLVAIVAASGCSSGSNSSRQGTQIPGVEAGSPGRNILIDPAKGSFQVIFDWTAGVVGGGNGWFVWRQRGGIRRFDFITKQNPYPVAGSLDEQRDFSPEGDRPASTFSCDWTRKSSTDEIAKMECAHIGVNTPLTQLLNLLPETPIEDRGADQMIAGRPAACYSLATPLQSYTFCVDAIGIPLSLHAAASGNLEEESIKAISVDTNLQELRPVDGLPIDPNPASSATSPPAPFADLDLPKSLPGS